MEIDENDIIVKPRTCEKIYEKGKHYNEISRRPRKEWQKSCRIYDVWETQPDD